jgi:hypothetical protein
VQGNGSFESSDFGLLTPDTWYVNDGLILGLDFIGTELGIVEIELIVRDREGIEETTNILFEVIHNPFTWEVNSSETDVAINIEAPFTMTLDNIGRDQSVTYETRIYFVQGTGKVFVTDNSGNDIEVILNQPTVIEGGIHSGNVVLSEVGTTEIIFEITDSNGQVKEESLIFEADIIDFTFEGTPQSYAIFLDDKININFLIQELLGGNDTYESRFVFNSGNASLTRTVNGIEETLIPGSLYQVDLDAYYWEFEATDVGDIDMTFYAQNISGVEHEVNIVIIVSDGIFDFKATEAQDVASVNDAVVINFDINETGNSGLPYQLQYTSTLNGFLVYKGIQYNAGDIITITELNSTGTYTGLESGGHVIAFDATNSFGETVSSDSVIIFNEDDFAFSAVAVNGNVFLNDTTDFNFNILDNNNTSTYQIYYTVSGTGSGTLSSGGLTYAPNVLYNIIDSGTTWEFEGTGLGDLTYTFYVVNNSGNEKSRVIDVNVLSEPEPDFNFTAVAETNIEYVNEEVHINFSIDEIEMPNVATYSMVFTTTGIGTMTYLGNTYNAGDTIIVAPENFVFVYQGLSSGVHDITFTISNNNAIPIQKTNTVSITFEEVDFVLNVSGGGDACVNEIKDLNVFLSQDKLDPLIDYTVVYTFDENFGEIKRNGFDVVSGIGYPITVGNTELKFEGLAAGTVNIDVTVTDSNGVIHSETVTYQVKDVDFNLITSGGGSMFVNETENFNVILAQEKLNPLIDYTVVYTFAGGSLGNGTIKTIGGFDILLGQSYPISVGNTEMQFTAETEGPVTIVVTVTDSNGLVQSETVIYQLNNIDFNVIASTPADTSMFANEKENFNVLLSQDQIDPLINYTVIYTFSSGSVTRKSDNFTFVSGNSYPISPGNIEMVFESEAIYGDVVIGVEVTDSNGVSHSDTITFQVNDIEYFFTSIDSPSANALIDEEISLNFNISETIPSIANYLMKYEVTSSIGEVISEGASGRVEGDWYNVNTGSFAWNFKAPSAPGTVEITFTVINSITLEEKQIVITVTVT